MLTTSQPKKLYRMDGGLPQRFQLGSARVVRTMWFRVYRAWYNSGGPLGFSGATRLPQTKDSDRMRGSRCGGRKSFGRCEPHRGQETLIAHFAGHHKYLRFGPVSTGIGEAASPGSRFGRFCLHGLGGFDGTCDALKISMVTMAEVERSIIGEFLTEAMKFV